MPLRTHNAQVAVEIEASEGVKETLEAADVLLAQEPDFSPSVDANERDPVRSGLSPWTSVPGKRSARLRFQSWLFGTATAGAANHLSDVLKACGVGETLVAGTSATYNPETDSVPSVTAGLYEDGVAYRLWGARGEASLLLEAGRPGVWTFDLQGADWEKVDSNLLSGVTLPSILPPVFQGATITIGGTSLVVSRVQLTFGNTLALRESAAANSGNVSTVITARRPILSFDPEDVLVATQDFLGDWKAGETLTFSCSFGSATGNSIAISVPKVQYQGISRGNRNGISILEVQGLCCMDSAGDDEWEIEIT